MFLNIYMVFYIPRDRKKRYKLLDAEKFFQYSGTLDNNKKKNRKFSCNANDLRETNSVFDWLFVLKIGSSFLSHIGMVQVKTISFYLHNSGHFVKMLTGSSTRGRDCVFVIYQCLKKVFQSYDKFYLKIPRHSDEKVESFLKTRSPFHLGLRICKKSKFH